MAKFSLHGNFPRDIIPLCLVFGLRDGWREGGGAYEGKRKFSVPKMGLSFLDLYSKFHFFLRTFFWFWVEGSLAWVGDPGNNQHILNTPIGRR